MRRVREERGARVPREAGDEAAPLFHRRDRRVEVEAQRADQRLGALSPVLHELAGERGEARDVDGERRRLERPRGLILRVLLKDEFGDERVHVRVPARG